MKKLPFILSLLLLSLSLQAQTVAGIEIADTLAHSKPGKKLVLNGAGIRTKFIFDIYIGALYLEQKQTTAEAVYSQPGEKHFHMHSLYDEIDKEKVTRGWSEGFKNNHTETELVKLQARIDQFNSLFPDVKKDDVIDIKFIPDTGTSVIVNGKTQGSIASNDFFTALLKIWLGEQPADNDLKQALLGNIND